MRPGSRRSAWTNVVGPLTGISHGVQSQAEASNATGDVGFSQYVQAIDGLGFGEQVLLAAGCGLRHSERHAARDDRDAFGRLRVGREMRDHGVPGFVHGDALFFERIELSETARRHGRFA